MKLQIISRLQKQDLNKDTQHRVSIARQTTEPHRNYLAENLEEYIVKTRLNQNSNDKKKRGENVNAVSFFANFQQNSVVKYQPSPVHELHVKRSLASKLSQMMAQDKKEKEAKKEKLVSDFTFSQALLKVDLLSYQSIPTRQPTECAQDYYHIQQTHKPKQRVRKFNSLISLRPESLQERKPGFIKKRDISLCRQNQKETVLTQCNKENSNNMNIITMKRQTSKEKMENVDQEIVQSKERILKIRKELNQIYMSRKGNKEQKLKLL